MQTLVVLLGLAVLALGIALWRQRTANATFLTRLQTELGSPIASDSAVLAAAAALRRRAEDADSELAQLRGALAASPIGVVIVDEAGSEVFANEAVALYTRGRAGDAIVGIRLREMIREIITGGEESKQQVEVLTPPPRTVQLNAAPLLIDHRRVGAVVIAHDVTRRSEIDTIRRDFVANASHELKTPLGALRLLAEALATTPDRATHQSLSKRIQVEAARMTKLVENILDLSLIEEHQTVRGVVQLAEVIDAAAEKTRLVAETLEVDVAIECEDVAVMGDRRRLTSAVANLLENAITYTAAKGMEHPPPVEIRLHRVGSEAVIEIEDYGIGIAERHQRRIFERFYRVDMGRSRASGGTGLGLAIARHVVQNHGGEIEVDSTPGKGSTFRIALPAREA